MVIILKVEASLAFQYYYDKINQFHCIFILKTQSDLESLYIKLVANTNKNVRWRAHRQVH